MCEYGIRSIIFLAFICGSPLGTCALKPLASRQEPVKSIHFKHLLKGGGTFISEWLSRSGFQVCDDRSNTCTDSDFVLDMMRNPFDYYVSVWAYRSEKDMLHLHEPIAAGSFTRHNNDLDEELNKSNLLNEETALLCSDKQNGCCGEEDISRFRRWMHLVNFGAVNWLTHRVFNLQFCSKRSTCFRYHQRTEANSIELDFAGRMEQLSTSPAHCWVETSSILTDVRNCVARYQKYEPAAKSIALTSMAEVLHNPSNHCSTKKYYDVDTIKKVKEGDAQIVKYFKYKVP